MNEQVLQAFLQVRDGRSPDVVVTDPDLNSQFLAACRALGAVGTDFELNHCLYNLRKQGDLEDHPTTRPVRLQNQDDYRFAAEIAARFIEKRDHVALDRIICDPALARAFDVLAAELAPGFTPFEYRFTALSLRKKRGLQPEIVGRVIVPEQVLSFRVADLDIDQIPRQQGIYIFSNAGEGVLYLGEAGNLRDRIRKHLDHSDRKDLARWLWDHGIRNLFLEIHVLPAATALPHRRAVELELIRSRKPRFNISGVDTEE